MKIMKRFIALFLSLTMLSTSVAFAGESVKGHFSAFDDVPSEVAPQGELDAVSGKMSLAGALVVLGIAATAITAVVVYNKLRIRSKITSRFGHFAPMAW
jgi:hypothetical protein